MNVATNGEFTGRNLVVCCDGTDNEFGDENTNVVRLLSLAVKCGERQVPFYDPGLGTFPAPGALTPISKWVTKQLGSAFGYGLAQNIADAYGFLVEHYQPGDRIYLFGFSRGAYTVRVVAALIHVCGLMHKQNRNLIPYAFDLFKKEATRAKKLSEREEKRTGKQPPLELPLCDEFKKVFSMAPEIHFIGVWDTVSSVGTIYDPFYLPYTRWNPSVKTVRHAISIDEERKFFRPNMWSTTLPGSEPTTDAKQVWFAGVHADIGGGYIEAESALAKVGLAWMLEEAMEAGLQIDQATLPSVLPDANTTPPPVAASALGPKHNELDRLKWKILQRIPRRSWAFEAKTGKYRWKWNFSAKPACRHIEEGSLVHRTVFERMKLDPTYRPVNLPASVRDDEGLTVDWKATLGVTAPVSTPKTVTEIEQ